MNNLLKIGKVMLFSLVFLVGCGSGSIEGEETVNLKLWLDHNDYAEALIDELEDVFPHINFTFENVGATDSLTKLTLDGPAGISGDIMLMTHRSAFTGMNDNLLLPLGDHLGEMIEERILENAMNSVRNDGKYFGVPLTTESVALFYNKTLLEEYGLEVAETFEELIEQAEVFNDPSDNRFIFRFQSGNAYDCHFFLTAHGYELFGPNHNDLELIDLNTPEVVAGLEFFQSLRDILPVPEGDLDGANTVGAFVHGEVPYVITGPWSITEVEEEGDFEWGVKKIPTINGVQPITFSGNIVGGISAFTEHPDEARAVLEYMASDEGLQIIYEKRGSIPALKDVSQIVGLSDDLNQLAILAQAEYSLSNPTLPEMTAYWSAAGAMFQAVWEGLLTPEEAAERALEDFNSAVLMTQQ